MHQIGRPALKTKDGNCEIISASRNWENVAILPLSHVKLKEAHFQARLQFLKYWAITLRNTGLNHKEYNKCPPILLNTNMDRIFLILACAKYFSSMKLLAQNYRKSSCPTTSFLNCLNMVRFDLQNIWFHSVWNCRMKGFRILSKKKWIPKTSYLQYTIQLYFLVHFYACHSFCNNLKFF